MVVAGVNAGFFRVRRAVPLRDRFRRSRGPLAARRRSRHVSSDRAAAARDGSVWCDGGGDRAQSDNPHQLIALKALFRPPTLPELSRLSCARKRSSTVAAN